jgi:bacteriorhodopsin
MDKINLEMVKNSFHISYSFFITTGTICLIESLRTKDAKIRHIMNIETCISIVATIFYGKFIEMIKDKEKHIDIDYEKINLIRYIDWFLSTPLMLLGLSLVFTYNLKIELKFKQFLIMILLNFGMLLFGYLGEINKINKQFALTGGFILFAFLFYYIYSQFIRNKKNTQNFVIYMIFLIIWSIYGIVYLNSLEIKNIIFNILDVIAKCIVGIGFWAYLTGIFH